MISPLKSAALTGLWCPPYGHEALRRGLSRGKQGWGEVSRKDEGQALESGAEEPEHSIHGGPLKVCLSPFLPPHQCPTSPETPATWSFHFGYPTSGLTSGPPREGFSSFSGHTQKSCVAACCLDLPPRQSPVCAGFAGRVLYIRNLMEGNRCEAGVGAVLALASFPFTSGLGRVVGGGGGDSSGCGTDPSCGVSHSGQSQAGAGLESTKVLLQASAVSCSWQAGLG